MSERSSDHVGWSALPVVDPEEIASVEKLRARLGQVPERLDRWNTVARLQAKPRSELALDDEFTAWRQLSHGVTLMLNHASDNLRTLHVLLPPEGEFRLPMVSHYPIARSALEAGSVALWILAPGDPRERIHRHLRNAARELRDEADLLAAVHKEAGFAFSSAQIDRSRKQTNAWKRKHVGQIRACAKRVGVPDPTTAGWPVGFAEIIREATTHTGMPGSHGEFVWRQISGLSHPSSIRAVRASQREELLDHGDGTHGIRLTSDIATAKMSVEAAMLQFKHAVELMGARKIRPGDRTAYQPAQR